MKKWLLLSALFSLPAFSSEILLREVELKAKKETFKDSLEVREIRESFAKDVGEALTKIEGISKFRRGGIANDIVLRAFQRDNINVLIDDYEIHGACPNRMDPPAFHVDFSEVEKIEVIKGPFDVKHQGSLGGLINIITKKPEEGFRLKLNLTLGSFDYRNISPVISYSDNRFYGLAGYSYRYSKPYKDGDGKRITEYPTGMNAYKPEAINSKAFEINTYWTKFGFKPLENHEFELGYTKQDAKHVLYPALMMDAIYDKADRFNLNYKVGKISDLLGSLGFQLYYTKVDHWMDNRYRMFMGNPPEPYTMATDAKTKMLGARLEAELMNLTLGLEAYKRNWDAINYMWMGMNMYMSQNVIPDVEITNFGVFGEYKRTISPKARLVAGLRIDRTKSEANSSKANTNLYFDFHNTRSTSKTDTYPSGNVQIFYNLTPDLELFTGVGYGVRVPDQQERYFALRRMCNPSMGNTFCAWVGNPNLKPSKNLEFDLGVKHQREKSLTKFTIFASYVQDYITLHRKGLVNNTSGLPQNAQAMTYANVDARFFGVEASSTYNLWKNLFLFGGVSYTEGRKNTNQSLNITDSDVAEVPPLKGRVGLRYDTGMWFVESELVASATQNKVDSNLNEQKTSGYGVVNLKAGVSYKGFTLNAGVENLLDKRYFEHFSYVRNPFAANVKIPEPGRSLYLTASYQF